MSEWTIYKAKIKRFAKQQCKEKILMTKQFYKDLEDAVNRVIDQSVAKAIDGVVGIVDVNVPKQNIEDSLICRKRVEYRVNQIDKTLKLTPRFYNDLNSYVGAIVVASVRLMQGVYLNQIATGDAVAGFADKIGHTSTKQTKQVQCTDIEDDPTWVPSLPGEKVEVQYNLAVQGAILECRYYMFTGRTTQQITTAIKKIVARYLEFIGITDPATIKITKITRLGGITGPTCNTEIKSTKSKGKINGKKKK